MLTVDLIRKVRMSLSRGKSYRGVSKRYNLSRNTVRKIARSEETELKYPKRAPRYPVFGPVKERLAERLVSDEEAPASHCRSGRKLFEELRSEGYEGSYASVRRYVKFWKESHRRGLSSAYVPLDLARGEAFQFDWSEETVELGGVCHKLQVAQVRLC